MKRSFVVRYGLAVVLPIVFGLIHRGLHEMTWDLSMPFVLLLPAVLASAYYGGFGPGTTTTALSALIAWFFWIEQATETLGRAAPLLGVGLFSASGVVVSLLCEALTTTRARAEGQALEARRANDRLLLAQKYAEAGVWDWETENEAEGWPRANGETYWSDAHFEVLGRPPARAPGFEEFLTLVQEEDRERVRDAFRRVAADPAADRLDVTYRVNRDGAVRWLRTLGRIERSARGAPLRAAGITVDVTEAAETRAALVQASQAKDAFIAMLSHELRNPIHAISGALALAERLDGEQTARALVVIRRQVGHLERIVSDMLDVTHALKGKLVVRREPLDLGALVRASVDALGARCETERHRIEVDADEVWVDGDATRLDQVVTNLLTNAIKYTPEGGHVHVRLHGDADEAILEVVDDGQGLSPELRPRVFDLFVQGEQPLDRPAGGLGIGLTLVKNIVELHGGTITVESEGPGKGSRFTVRLPSHAAVLATHHESAIIARPQRILVVEDHDDSREMIRALLEAEGHDVHEALDGPAAVKEALAWRPDLVLLDVGLPVFDGFEVARRIRAGGGNMRLVALTGYGQEDDRARSAEAGFDQHVVKPVGAAQLSELARPVGRRAAS